MNLSKYSAYWAPVNCQLLNSHMGVPKHIAEGRLSQLGKKNIRDHFILIECHEFPFSDRALFIV